MTDRQDIDALLIGSLYGELSSTEEARLAAHLESHPADRTTLANLTWARDAVRESRILQVQFEPPQSVSALLLQEAHRRAPKPQEERSWFQRFMRSFMLHPAMAAAAMLVLVVGIAGTVYMRQGDHYAKQTADDSTVATPAAEPAQAPTGAMPEPPKAQDTAPTDNFAVNLDESSLAAEEAKREEASTEGKATTDDKRVARGDGEAAGVKKQPTELAMPIDEQRRPATTTAKTAKKPSRYLEVTTPDRAPKDLDSGRSRTVDRNQREDSVAVGGAASGAAPDAPRRDAPAPAGADRPTAPSVAQQPAPPPAPEEALREKQDPKPDPVLAWAKEQHGKLIAQVKAGKCQTAAAIAVQISNRAPAYYASNVESDRTIKQCMPYITAQREKEAERVQRAKATQRRAVEPAKPAPTSTK